MGLLSFNVVTPAVFYLEKIFGPKTSEQIMASVCLFTDLPPNVCVSVQTAARPFKEKDTTGSRFIVKRWLPSKTDITLRRQGTTAYVMKTAKIKGHRFYRVAEVHAKLIHYYLNKEIRNANTILFAVGL